MKTSQTAFVLASRLEVCRFLSAKAARSVEAGDPTDEAMLFTPL